VNLDIHERSFTYYLIKGAQVQSWQCLGLNLDAYERLPMLSYSLKHVESSLCISSTQRQICKKLKIEFTIRIVNSHDVMIMFVNRSALFIASIFLKGFDLQNRQDWTCAPSKPDIFKVNKVSNDQLLKEIFLVKLQLLINLMCQYSNMMK